MTKNPKLWSPLANHDSFVRASLIRWKAVNPAITKELLESKVNLTKENLYKDWSAKRAPEAADSQSKSAVLEPSNTGICFINFQVDTNYYRLLRDALSVIYEREVQLPFEYCSFTLNYFPVPQTLYLHQNQTTGKITAMKQDGELSTDSENDHRYLHHVYAVCVAIDAKLVVKSILGKDNASMVDTEWPVGDSYELLELKQTLDATNRLDKKAKGSKRLHVRRGHYMHFPDRKVWRRWSIVGSLSLGSITKDYSVQV